MHWADRYCLIHKAGYTPTRIARELGCNPNAVSQVLRDQARSYNIASFIAAITKTPLSRLWPDGCYSEPPRQAKTRRAA
ncbi:hypothetical protein Tgr7_0406 [Thioalkalivibrio sulfidiphilus HL-EbGr7]|uniref:Ner winged helix-turn-helix DNA-binding domain-containing protein n=1 Tax=Thioalkalivibrio sulfidiphilus (strain HL-EbGR7) TaxID=396588 RepID=B8GUZ3_THISH|nr:hypothetical protein Tgr7_0406 [Thioalkalivibrio sulfidiphilus HL-EbGr7]